MPTTYTANTNMAEPAHGDTSWDTPIIADLNFLDAVAAIGGLCVALHEVPSSSLNVKVSAGNFRASTGSIISYAGTASQGCTASLTNYLYLDDAGALHVSTSAFPASLHVRLATVVAGSSTITSITDARLPFVSTGVPASLSLAAADASAVVVVHTGTTNGVELGGASTDLLGFWGATPIARPAGSAQAALTNSTGGTTGTTLSAMTGTYASDFANLNNNLTRLFAQGDAIRTALVNAGLIKGSA